jgi:hypothetical protein
MMWNPLVESGSLKEVLIEILNNKRGQDRHDSGDA